MNNRNDNRDNISSIISVQKLVANFRGTNLTTALTELRLEQGNSVHDRQVLKAVSVSRVVWQACHRYRDRYRANSCHLRFAITGNSLGYLRTPTSYFIKFYGMKSSSIFSVRWASGSSRGSAKQFVIYREQQTARKRWIK